MKRRIMFSTPKNLAVGETVTAMVTCERGSWKWQDAYQTATYRPHTTRDGRLIWTSAYKTGKYAIGPKIGYPEVDVIGSLHNRGIITTVNDYGDLIAVGAY